MAVYLMGEGNESTPLLIGRDIPHIEFTTTIPYETSVIAPEKDIFRPLLQSLQSPNEEPQ
jgi:F420-0:gamma-glutamyl ligase